MGKLQSTLASWQRRKISLLGKTLLLNSRLLAKLWYLAYFVPFPAFFFTRLQKLLQAFLWDDRHPQIALATLCTSTHLGGLGLMDPRIQVTAIKGWWLHRISSHPQPPWASLARLNFQERYAPEDWSLNFLVLNPQPSRIRHKGLWNEIYLAWSSLQGSFPEEIDPLTIGDDPPLQVASLAGVPLPLYTVKAGAIFLQNARYPLLGHERWVTHDPSCILPWHQVWKHFSTIRRSLPPSHVVLWWRFLHSNIMTADRLSHYSPDISPSCRPLPCPT